MEVKGRHARLLLLASSLVASEACPSVLCVSFAVDSPDQPPQDQVSQMEVKGHHARPPQDQVSQMEVNGHQARLLLLASSLVASEACPS